MRHVIIRLGGWLFVTAIAVSLSWFGVRNVLREAVDPPRAPVPGLRADDTASTRRPPAEPVAAPAATTAPPTSAAPSGTKSATQRPNAATGRESPAQRTTGSRANARSYQVKGGQAVFDIGQESARLITASPEPGWTMRVWNNDRWIRVDFMRQGTTSSIFVTWNGHAPIVDTYVS